MPFREIITSLLGIFLFMIPGLLFRKMHVLSEEQSDGLSSFVVNLTWPCLVISGMQIEYSAEILRNSGYALALCVLVFAAAFCLSFPLSKILKLEKSKQYLTAFMLVFGNTGFVGIPVIRALYGEQGLFYAAILEAINDALLFTVGALLIQTSAQKKEEQSPAAEKKTGIPARNFLSPGFLGVMVGLALFLCRIKLPALLAEPMEMIGNTTTPITMFLIGFQIGGLKRNELFGDGRVYGILAAKLLLVPCICWLIIRCFGSEISLLEKVVIVDFAMPAASASVILSRQYKGETDFASKTVLLSTVLSLATIALCVMALEM